MATGREAFNVRLTRVAGIPLDAGPGFSVAHFVHERLTCDACPGAAISSPAPRFGDGARQAIGTGLYEADC